MKIRKQFKIRKIAANEIKLGNWIDTGGEIYNKVRSIRRILQVEFEGAGKRLFKRKEIVRRKEFKRIPNNCWTTF